MKIYMKNILIILLSALSLTAFAQDKKTVAVLDPICRDNSVNQFYQQMVRGAMESAITSSTEYEAFDRSALDLIQKEQAFQRTGAVNDSQIKQMGKMAGVDYVLVSEVSAYEGYLSVVVKILNVTTGKYDKSIDDFAQLSPETVKNKCNELGSSIFGNNSNTQKMDIQHDSKMCKEFKMEFESLNEKYQSETALSGKKERVKQMEIVLKRLYEENCGFDENWVTIVAGYKAECYGNK